VAQLQKSSAVEGRGQGTEAVREALESGFYVFRRTFRFEVGRLRQRTPKFPRPSVLNFLLRYYASTERQEALDMVLLTLREMAKAACTDQLGGGFIRYSVDERWFVPHFEEDGFTTRRSSPSSYRGSVPNHRRSAVRAGPLAARSLRAPRYDGSRRRILFGGRCR